MKQIKEDFCRFLKVYSKSIFNFKICTHLSETCNATISPNFDIKGHNILTKMDTALILKNSSVLLTYIW